ncbi:MAG: hypothetical protein IIB77_02355 [Proteobacteria bacterium]|nr:hypothetical protein [Pseudomonadota bacterium]
MKSVLLIVVFLTGCASVEPLYFEASVGKRLDNYSDYWVQSARAYQCSKPWEFNGELGWEFEHDWRLGLHHESQLFCGKFGAFNSKPEIYTHDIRVTKKWGGL